MKIQLSALAIAASVLVASCGGGGGGTTAATATPVAVTPPVTAPVTPIPTQPGITAANAKAVAATALDAVANSAALMAPLGLLSVLSSSPGATLLTLTQSCASGGTAVVSGTIANTLQPTVGDRFLINFNSCGVASVFGGTLALTGTSNSTILAYSSTAIATSSTIDGISLNFLGVAVRISGDQRAEIAISPSSVATYVLSGKKLTIITTRASGVRNLVVQDYLQSITGPATSSAYTTTATIQSDNPIFGTLGGNFVVATATPVVRNNSTGQLVSGSVRAVGAANAALLATVNADGTTTIQIDANGDGIYESSIITTAIELASLL